MYTLKEYKTNSGTPYVVASGIDTLDIFKTFDCGQCFRFEPVSLFGNKYEFGGVAFSRYVVFAQNSFDEIIVYGSSAKEFEQIWAPFLSLDTSYSEINSHILSVVDAEHMKIIQDTRAKDKKEKNKK